MSVSVVHIYFFSSFLFRQGRHPAGAFGGVYLPGCETEGGASTGQGAVDCGVRNGLREVDTLVKLSYCPLAFGRRVKRKGIGSYSQSRASSRAVSTDLFGSVALLGRQQGRAFKSKMVLPAAV